MGDEEPAGTGMTIRFGRLEVDVPRSLGFYGGITAAVAFGVIEAPLGMFVAAVPLIKMLGGWDLPWPLRFASELAEGAAQPVGGEGEGTLRLKDPEEERARDIELAEAVRRGETLRRV